MPSYTIPASNQCPKTNRTELLLEWYIRKVYLILAVANPVSRIFIGCRAVAWVVAVDGGWYCVWKFQKFLKCKRDELISTTPPNSRRKGRNKYLLVSLEGRISKYNSKYSFSPTLKIFERSSLSLTEIKLEIYRNNNEGECQICVRVYLKINMSCRDL